MPAIIPNPPAYAGQYAGTAHSYLSVAEAADVAGTLLGLDAFAAADDARAAAALSEATATIDAQRWQGGKLDAAQLRAFPRRPYGDGTRWDRLLVGGVEVDAVPFAILQAAVVEADALLAGAAAARERRQQGLASQSRGPMSESYAAPAAGGIPQLCQRAETFVRRYRLKSGRLL